MGTASITATHRERLAYVYVRQSTLWQVNEHQESTERQYRLQERALDLGWPPPAIAVIDEDQGRSGSSSTARTGFRRLVVYSTTTFLEGTGSSSAPQVMTPSFV